MGSLFEENEAKIYSDLHAGIPARALLVADIARAGACLSTAQPDVPGPDQREPDLCSGLARFSSRDRLVSSEG